MYCLLISYTLVILLWILNDVVVFCYGRDTHRRGSNSKRFASGVKPQISEDEHEKQILSSLFQDDISSSSPSSYKDVIKDRRKKGSKSSTKRTKRRRSKTTRTTIQSSSSKSKRPTVHHKSSTSLSKTTMPSGLSSQIRQLDQNAKESSPRSALNLKKEIDILRNMTTRVDHNLTAKVLTPTPQNTKTVNSKQYATRPATTMSLTTPWARKFILSRPKDALLPIPREYLSDGFNLVNIAPVIHQIFHEHNNTIQSTSSIYKSAIKLILEEEDGTMNSTSISKDVQHAAEVVYQLVHARFVCSPRGLDTIRRMFERNIVSGTIYPIFGRCTRMSCNGTALLPYGMSDQYDISRKGTIQRKAMRYCCCCKEVFFCWDSKADGCAWGPSFAFLFLMTHGRDIFPTTCPSSDITNLKSKSNQPPRKVFGFLVHPASEMKHINKKRRHV